ncbi:MAG TPA: type II toxin-antitoxin system RelE/ParE family toxin [Roseateles sp.]
MPFIWSKAFNGGCASRRCADADLCRAVAEMERGLIDANLGSGLFKKRIGRSGAGKRDGYRVIVAHRQDAPWFFLEGYAKNVVANIEAWRLDSCKQTNALLKEMGADQLANAVESGFLKEVICDAQAQVRLD